MKKACILILAIVLSFSCLLTAGATAVTPNEGGASAQTIEYFPDGSYAVITITENAVASSGAKASGYVKSGSKSYELRNTYNELQWSVTVSGTFTYNNSTSSCTASSVSYSVVNSAWKVKAATASKSGNSAIGDFTVKRYVLGLPVQTESPHVVLSCSVIGALS